MRVSKTVRLLAVALVAVLGAAACGQEQVTPEGRQGPRIAVASFNFPESTLLAEIYAQALEADGYRVQRRLDLGSREIIFPSIERGEVDLLPEYIGSALSAGFERDLPTDADEGHGALSEAFAEMDVTVLAYAPAENTNVFVVSGGLASEHGLATISDLAEAGDVSFGGPPECEERETCFVGLRDTYGLDNVSFTTMPELSTRVSALSSGDIQLALLFSTDPIISEQGFVALEDDQGITPVENIVPVVSGSVVEAYGAELTDLIDSITERITTDVLLDLNGRVQLDNEEPADVAADWLASEDLV